MVPAACGARRLLPGGRAPPPIGLETYDCDHDQYATVRSRPIRTARTYPTYTKRIHVMPGVGIDIGYNWLLGPKQNLSVGLGFGVTRLLGSRDRFDLRDGGSRTTKLVNIGFAFWPGFDGMLHAWSSFFSAWPDPEDHHRPGARRSLRLAVRGRRRSSCAPAAIAKMRAGGALTDADRAPGSPRCTRSRRRPPIAATISSSRARRSKQRYRDVLRGYAPQRAVRLPESRRGGDPPAPGGARSGSLSGRRFSPSQLADLEEPTDALTIDATGSPDAIVKAIAVRSWGCKSTRNN